MHISQFLLLTFTVMVAIVIPGCSSKSDDSTTSTTTTLGPYSQTEFTSYLGQQAELMQQTNFANAEDQSLFVAEVQWMAADLNAISALDDEDLKNNVTASSPNIFSSYLVLFETLAGSGEADMYSGAVYTTDGSCTGADFETILANELPEYTAGESYKTVWQTVNISKATQCVPDDCLGDNSFTPEFMADYYRVAVVCSNQNTNVVTQVQSLQDALNTLNTKIEALDTSTYDTWNTTFYQSMKGYMDTLTEGASDRQANLTAAEAAITTSCTLTDADTEERMEKTCSGFGNAQKLTTAIEEGSHKHYDTYYWEGMENLFDLLLGFNYGSIQDIFCPSTDQYKSNSEFFCTKNTWAAASGDCEALFSAVCS